MVRGLAGWELELSGHHMVKQIEQLSLAVAVAEIAVHLLIVCCDLDEQKQEKDEQKQETDE